MISDFELRDRKTSRETESESEVNPTQKRQRQPRMRQLSVREVLAMREKRKKVETGSLTVASGSNFQYSPLISCTLGMTGQQVSADGDKVATGQPGELVDQGGGDVRGRPTCSASELNTCADSTHAAVLWVGTAALGNTGTAARLHSQEDTQGAKYFDRGNFSTRQ